MQTTLETNQTANEPWTVAPNEPQPKQFSLTREEEERFLATGRYEVVHGGLKKRTMPSPIHGKIQAKLTRKIGNYLEENPIGEVYTETNFELAEKLTRVPDVAFVANEKLVEADETASRFYFAPDLAIEVLSPSDIVTEVFEKLDEYFEFGSKQVWIVEPQRKILTVYYSPMKSMILGINDELVGSEILPNFRLKLSEIFMSPQP